MKEPFMLKILFSLMTLVSLTAFAADKAQEEMMKKWTEYSTPSETHKFLATMEGNWTYTQKMWEPQQEKPQESKGSATFKMILGGRYLQQEVKGEVMGQPYEGMGLTGYDNLKKKTISTWADNMGTSILTGSGEINLKKKAIAESGSFTCPMDKDNTAEYRSDWVMNDKNKMTFTMYNKFDGMKEMKMMEMVYTRAN